MDGASARAAVPLRHAAARSRRSLLLVSILTIAGYFQLFAEPYVMTQGGPLQSTVSVLYFMYEEGFKWWNLGFASAVAFVLFAAHLRRARCVQLASPAGGGAGDERAAPHGLADERRAARASPLVDALPARCGWSSVVAHAGRRGEHAIRRRSLPRDPTLSQLPRAVRARRHGALSR